MIIGNIVLKCSRFAALAKHRSKNLIPKALLQALQERSVCDAQRMHAAE